MRKIYDDKITLHSIKIKYFANSDKFRTNLIFHFSIVHEILKNDSEISGFIRSTTRSKLFSMFLLQTKFKKHDCEFL